MAWADRFLTNPTPPGRAEEARVRRHFDDADLVELTMALGLFVGFSKVLIALGLEPAEMDTTVLATPAVPT